MHKKPASFATFAHSCGQMKEVRILAAERHPTTPRLRRAGRRRKWFRILNSFRPVGPTASPSRRLYPPDRRPSGPEAEPECRRGGNGENGELKTRRGGSERAGEQGKGK